MSDNDAMSDSEFGNIDLDQIVAQANKSNDVSSENSVDESTNASAHKLRSSAAHIMSNESTSTVSNNNLNELDDIGEDDASEPDNHTNTNESSQPSSAAKSSGNKRKRLKRVDELPSTTQLSSVELDYDDYTDNEDDDIDNFIVDDTNGAYRDQPNKHHATHHTSTALQPSFQCTSTVYINKRKFLCWNLYGSIVCRDEDIYQSIEVTFSDSSINRPVRIRDYYNFSYGSLGIHGAIFASRSHIGTQKKLENSDEIDQNRNGVIFYRPFDSWAVNSEWTYTLLSGEEPTSVAIGKRYCAVATTSKYGACNIRIFGYSGVQRTILCISGPIVTMCSSDDKLCVVYHKSAPFNSIQQLQCIIYDMKSNDIQSMDDRHHCTVLYDGQLPLAPGSTLHWLGFTSRGMLLSYDTQGVVRACSSVWGMQWIALLYVDTVKKNKSDYYWPIGCIDDKLMYVICKQSNRQPSVTPKPILQSVQLQLPLLSLSNHDIQLEEQYIRNELIYSWSNITHGESIKQQATLDKLLLQLINRCFSGSSTREVRGLDLASMIGLSKSLQVAIQIASKKGQSNLVSRMGLLLESKFNSNHTQSIDELNADKYSIESFIELEKQKVANKQARRVTLNSDVVNQPDDNDGEAEFTSKPSRLRKLSSSDSTSPNQKLPQRKNQLNKSASNEQENMKSYADINTNIIDHTVNKNTRQGKLFSSTTPAETYKSVSKVIPHNPFAKK